jgi:hypothetical protein
VQLDAAVALYRRFLPLLFHGTALLYGTLYGKYYRKQSEPTSNADTYFLGVFSTLRNIWKL